jgi:hypothetical protein
MKQLESHEKADRRKKRNGLIIGVMLIFLMFFSSISFAIYYASSGNDYDYGDDVLDENQEGPIHNGRYWVYNFPSGPVGFVNQVEDFENVDVTVDLGASVYSEGILYIDSEDEEIYELVAGNLGRFTPRYQKACYGACEYDLPERTCEDNLIVYKESGVEKVYQEDNCIFIEGSSLAADAFLYDILGK